MRRTIVAVLGSIALAASVLVVSVRPVAAIGADEIALDTVLDLPIIGAGGGGWTMVPEVRAAGDHAVFSVRISASDYRLYGSDGTEAGTVELSDASARQFNSSAGGLVFAPMTDAAHGTEVWVSDGTPSGTALLADTVPGPSPGASANPPCVGTLGAGFVADLTQEREPHAVSGIGGTASRLADVYPGIPGSSPCSFTEIGGRSVFTAYGPENELYVTDGTPSGTMLLADLDPGGSSSPWNLTRLADRVVFTALSPAGYELYWTDGVDVGPVRDVDPVGDGVESSLVHLGDEVLFADGGTELWRSDGTDAGTNLVTTISSTTYLDLAVVSDGVAYFVNDDFTELWRTDGSASGTYELTGLLDGSGLGIDTMAALDGRVWIDGFDDDGSVLWSTDGTEEGTIRLDDSLVPPTSSLDGVVATSDAIYVDIYDGTRARLQRVVMPPTRPLAVSAVTDTGSATVSWSPPANDNGREVTGYTVSTSSGGSTDVAAGVTSATLTGLTAGTSYTFTVTATNELGTSVASSVTASTTSPPAGGGGPAPTTVPTTVAPRPTTTTTAPATPPTTVAPPVSTGSGAVTIDAETGEIEEVEPATPDDEEAAGTVVTPDGEVISVTSDGRVFSSGGEDLGDLEDEDLAGEIVGIALYTPVTKADDELEGDLGYWLVGEDGGVFAFGSAPFLGSMGGRPLAAKVVGIVPHGRGYWLVAEDGGVFTFGTAPFFGSLGATHLNGPITALTPSTAGYWLVAADGGVFTFGDARFRGSLGATGSTSAVVGLLPDPSDGDMGYWLVRDDGTTARF